MKQTRWASRLWIVAKWAVPDRPRKAAIETLDTCHWRRKDSIRRMHLNQMMLVIEEKWQMEHTPEQSWVSVKDQIWLSVLGASSREFRSNELSRMANLPYVGGNAPMSWTPGHCSHRMHTYDLPHLSVGGSIYDICVIIGTVAYAPPKALANIQNTRRHNIGAMKERIWNTAMKRFHSPFSFRWRLIRTR